jgi:hypothetical protein
MEGEARRGFEYPSVVNLASLTLIVTPNCMLAINATPSYKNLYSERRN